MVWVFAFKYWVVSIEMPKAILQVASDDDHSSTASMREEQQMTSELWYSRVEKLGIGINLVAVLAYAVIYGILTMDP